jgi:hypothetical protein
VVKKLEAARHTQGRARPQRMRTSVAGSKPPLYTLAGVGSKNWIRLIARLIWESRKLPSSLPATSLYTSKHTRPDTAAVVVAMAGMIFPATIMH